MSSGPYSPHKVIHHQDRLDALKRGEQPVPVQAHLILTNICNQNCSFCAYRNKGFQSSELFVAEDGTVSRAYIPRLRVDEILGDFVEMGVKAVQFTGGGEPLAHPDHKEIFQLALGIGLDIALVTNGTLIRPETAKILSDAKWVRVSLDAATPQTYATMRGVPESHFGMATDGVRMLVENRKPGQIIGVGFVVNRDNWHEVYEAVGMCQSLGVDNVRISAAFTPEGIDHHKPFWREARDLITKAKDDFKGLRIFDLYGDRVGDLEQQSPDYPFCPYQHLCTYIGADLNVYRCCNVAYTNKGKIGSIANQSFRQFWLSDAKKRAMDFDARACRQCMFNNKNRFINYCISDNPEHANFI